MKIVKTEIKIPKTGNIVTCLRCKSILKVEDGDNFKLTGRMTTGKLELSSYCPVCCDYRVMEPQQTSLG